MKSSAICQEGNGHGTDNTQVQPVIKPDGMKYILVALLPFFLLLSSCGDSPLPGPISLSFPSEIPQAGFAAEQISKACESAGIKLYINEENAVARYRISLSIDPELGYEAYKINQENNRIFVTGGDANGLMYAGIDLAEAIALLHGIPRAAHQEILQAVPCDVFKDVQGSSQTISLLVTDDSHQNAPWG